MRKSYDQLLLYPGPPPNPDLRRVCVETDDLRIGLGYVTRETDKRLDVVCRGYTLDRRGREVSTWRSQSIDKKRIRHIHGLT